ncbi:MAG: N-formylglutamate amidohydrolase, partial [Candidatus Thorarchaeota archaeon]
RVLLGIDCHTMVAEAPPICGDAGTTRPLICLSNADGTCPEGWTSLMAECLENAFGFTVSINKPFKGGHIIRSHSSELPWLQLELSRAEIITKEDKRRKILTAFQCWCERAQEVKSVRKE